jgi:hypothetical protein
MFFLVNQFVVLYTIQQPTSSAGESSVIKRLYLNLLFPGSPSPLGVGEVVLGEHGALLE